MRAALWLLSLFALAAAGAWLAGHNHGTVTLFLAPLRVDVSLNLAALSVLLVVLVVVLAQKALAALLSLPKQAHRWRVQQKERAAHADLLDAMGHFMAGRFLRARKAAESVLDKEDHLRDVGVELDHAVSLRSVAHIMAAEASHALQDRDRRQHHLAQAVMHAQQGHSVQRQTLTEGVQLRAARWLLDDRDAQGSLDRLKELPPASGRRMVAMRLQLKAARLAGQPAQALETAVLLAKHRAFSPSVAQSLVSRLILEWVASTHDAEGMQRVWKKLTPTQKLMPEVAAEAALRWLQLGGEPLQARQWLQAVITPLLDPPRAWRDAVDVRFVQALDASLADIQSHDALDWLSRIERAQLALPRDPYLQYLAGMLCWRHKLWGKAQGLLTQAIKSLVEPTLRRQAWCALAELAEQRQDADAAKTAWKQAAQAI